MLHQGSDRQDGLRHLRAAPARTRRDSGSGSDEQADLVVRSPEKLLLHCGAEVGVPAFQHAAPSVLHEAQGEGWRLSAVAVGGGCRKHKWCTALTLRTLYTLDAPCKNSTVRLSGGRGTWRRARAWPRGRSGALASVDCAQCLNNATE